jgi:hypothetical protein
MTSPSVQLSLYADDALFTTTSGNLRTSWVYMYRQLNLLQPWLTKWLMKVNTYKCEVTITTFTRTTGQADNRHLTLNRDDIPWESMVKYLGVVLDKRLTLTPYVLRWLASRSSFGSIGPLLRSSKLTIAAKIRLYTALLRPLITYVARA